MSLSLIHIFGHRPVRVVGYELPDFGRSGTLPIFKGAGGLQMVTLDNGAVCRGLHGNLRREGARNYNYLYYGLSLIHIFPSTVFFQYPLSGPSRWAALNDCLSNTPGPE